MFNRMLGLFVGAARRRKGGVRQPPPLLPAPTCAEFGTGALGWDASGWAAADTEVATISHPRGDLKKVSRSTAGLRRAAYVAKAAQPSSRETHYRVGAAGRACSLCHPGLLCS